MSHLYITDHDAVLTVDGGCFVVTRNREEFKRLPIKTLDSVTIVGRASISTAAIQRLLTESIPVSYFSSFGKYYGKLSGLESPRATLMKTQFEAFDDEEFSLALAKKMISSKIHNQRVIAKRYADDAFSASAYFNAMKTMEKKVIQAANRSELMGYEGVASKNYFHVLNQSVLPTFRFAGRNRRPPRDPFNALLSFGYSLLSSEIMAKIEKQGLNPYAGPLHKVRDYNPSLVNDLVEEWRPLIVDATVMSVVQGKEIVIDDFSIDYSSGEVRLTPAATKKYVRKIENKLNQRQAYISNRGISCSFREAMDLQCEKLVETIKLKNHDFYVPIRIR